MSDFIKLTMKGTCQRVLERKSNILSVVEAEDGSTKIHTQDCLQAGEFIYYEAQESFHRVCQMLEEGE